MKPISIVLLAQHAKLFNVCLTALKKHTKLPYELIVVNDGADPAIARRITAQRSVTVRTIAPPERIGVAAGYNRGAAAASGDLIVFMRDHVIVTAGWLEGLAVCLDADPNTALAGPLSTGVSGGQNAPPPDRAPGGRVGKSAGPDAESALDANRLLSFLLLVRKDVFNRLGGFDEKFAMESYEDDDLCYRALREGYRLKIATASYVIYTSPPPLFPDDPGWFGRQMAANRQVGIDKWGADLLALLYNWKRPVTVSLCMIVKNEEQTLERCLSGVADLVDEIVILDTGSTDRTKEIAGRFTDRVYDFVWVNDFAAARNKAFSYATKDYIFWLDADDILLDEDRSKFLKLVANLPTNTDAVSMHYHLSRDEYGNVTTSLRRNRLVRRNRKFPWIGVVHEYLAVGGNILNSDIAVTHDRKHGNSSRNLRIYEEKYAAGEIFGPRDIYYFGNELYDHGQWERAAEQYEKLLEHDNVWVEDRIGACGKAAECYQQLGKLEMAKRKALQSFAYALPRAENCCRLGLFHLTEQRYAEAAWWYGLATRLEKPANTSALLLHACWTWLPHLQLCVCYDRMGDYAAAYEANERAAAYMPQESRILANRAYLKRRLEEKE